MRRKTIKLSFELDGIALHSGINSSVKFVPAAAGTGIIFVRTDLPSAPVISARAENVSETTRGTTLAAGNASVMVIEHIMAAVSALGITDIRIEMSCAEPPAMDGSALPFFSALKKSGMAALDGDIAPLTLDTELVLEDGGSVVRACPSDRFAVGFVIDFPGTPVGRQEFGVDISEASFEKEIAPARTFGFLSEIEELKKRGLALGASTDNALAVGPAGYANKPRFENEAVRHKILDLVGDLALAGRPVIAHILADRSNHRLNTALARALSKI